MDYWSALMIGVFGSLHCVGMCGPIALALPLTTKEKSKVILQSLLYHLGRIFTYSLMGILMGLLGWGIVLAGYQKAISIGIGIVLIISVIFSFSLKQNIFNVKWLPRFFSNIKARLGKLLAIKSNSSALSIGFLNGFLPCGLVYIALAGAISSGGILQGGLYMACFGLGTLPLMFALMTMGNFNRQYFLRLRKYIPVGLVIFGLLLIYRGVKLQIPTAIEFWETTNFQIMCH